MIRFSKLLLALGALVFTSMDVAALEPDKEAAAKTPHVLAQRPSEIWGVILGYLDRESENALNEATCGKELGYISDVIRGKRMSRGIIFNMETIETANTAQFCTVLENYQGVTSLDFKNMDPAILLTALGMLPQGFVFPKLQELNVIEFHFQTGDSFFPIFHALSARIQMMQLRDLNLEYNRLGVTRVMAALDPILPQMTELTSLRLAQNNLEEAGVLALTPLLSKMTKLTRLNLAGNELGTARAMAALAQLLSQMTQLTDLDLGHNDLGHAGAMAALVPALAQMTKLTHLGLADSNLRDAEAIALALVLPQMTKLTDLNLLINDDLGDAGKAALAQFNFVRL